MKSSRCLRRMCGFLRVRVRELRLEEVFDPRRRQGRRHGLGTVLKTMLLGLMAECRGFAELERLTMRLSRSTRRLLQLKGRLPDTTLRDVSCLLNAESLRAVLHRCVKAAQRRKALKAIALPFHMVSMDGKATATPSWEGPYAQKHHPDGRAPYGLLRTITSVLSTARAKPCIDVSPIPATTNEMGHFVAAFEQLRAAYGKLFRLVTYDAGASSEANARHVVDAGYDYLFRLNDERHEIQQTAMTLMQTKNFLAQDHEVRGNDYEVFRRLKLFGVNHPDTIWPNAQCRSAVWKHARVLLLLETETRKKGKTSIERRYFISSLSPKTLSHEQWIWAIVRHWRVETAHQIIDTAFAEDEAPWVRSNPNGMLALVVLRRIAFTLLSLFRSITQRSDEKRRMPWRELLEWVRDTLLLSEPETVAGLRERTAACG